MNRPNNRNEKRQWLYERYFFCHFVCCRYSFHRVTHHFHRFYYCCLRFHYPIYRWLLAGLWLVWLDIPLTLYSKHCQPFRQTIKLTPAPSNHPMSGLVVLPHERQPPHNPPSLVHIWWWNIERPKKFDYYFVRFFLLFFGQIKSWQCVNSIWMKKNLTNQIDYNKRFMGLNESRVRGHWMSFYGTYWPSIKLKWNQLCRRFISDEQFLLLLLFTFVKQDLLASCVLFMCHIFLVVQKRTTNNNAQQLRWLLLSNRKLLLEIQTES